MLTLLFFVKHAALLVAILAAAAGAGTLVLGQRESLAIRSALGLVVWGEALFLLAAGGWLHGAAIGLLFVVTIAGGIVRGLRIPRPAWFVAIATALFLVALQPPMAFDETMYHLPFVRSLAESGQLRFLGALRFPAFPQLHELLCVPVYLVAGDTATHLVSLAEMLIATGVVAAWARRFDARAAALAAALFLGSPIVLHLGTILYVDTALLLFVVAGFSCLFEDEQRQRPALAGLFFGAACSVKYLGGYFAIAALVMVFVMRRRQTLVFAAAAFVAALPTYLWLTLTTGNPLFPFAARVFGRNPWTLDAELLGGGRYVDMLRVPWDVTFARARMNQQPPVTPLLIGMLLLVAAAVLRDWRARALVVMSAIYLAIFTSLPQDTRYLLPLLPLFCVGAATVIVRRWPRWVLLVTIVAILPGLAYAGYRHVLLGMPPVTPGAREEVLALRVPGYRALQRAGTASVYVCRDERLMYHARGPLLGDFFGPHSYARVLDSPGPVTVSERLHGLGVEYLLVIRHACDNHRLTGQFALVYEDDSAQLFRVQRR